MKFIDDLKRFISLGQHHSYRSNTSTSVIEDIKKSERLAETVDVSAAVTDPLTTDRAATQFLQENMPKMNQKRKINYYALADPELRPQREG